MIEVTGGESSSAMVVAESESDMMEAVSATISMSDMQEEELLADGLDS